MVKPVDRSPTYIALVIFVVLMACVTVPLIPEALAEFRHRYNILMAMDFHIKRAQEAAQQQKQ